jgi:hypothetical protein
MQESLKEAMAAYSEVAAELKIKQAELKEVMDKVGALKQQLQDCVDEK